jgi:hypothetical protein
VRPLSALVSQTLSKNRISASALLLLALASPARLLAQFQPPTPDELKMTADPKAPGAAAVYLNVEEVTNDPLHYHMVYARIKVLTEKGKEYATVDMPYAGSDYKVTDIKARTIHSDGTVTPLEGKIEDLLVMKSAGNRITRRVINLPSVEVGSILEYRYQLRYDDNHYSSPFWEIQRPLFVHKAHYAFTPFKAFLPGPENATSSFLVDEHGHPVNSLVWWHVLPPGIEVKVDVAGHFSVDITDVPPIPDEEWMPPIHSLLYKVLFYYKGGFTASDFWVSEAKRWSKEVDHFAEPTTTIRDAVTALIAPGDSAEIKARKLYKAVQALDNTDYTRKKDKVELKQLGLHAAKRAEDTWSQKSGSSEDIALLYLAMLRAAGLTAYAMKVVDRENALFDPTYMNFDQLDNTVILTNAGGKDLVLDPGEKMCPFQLLSWRHASAGGIRQSPEGRSAGITPSLPYSANTVVRSGDLDVDEHGAVNGRLTLVFTGQEALRWRQASIENDLDEVKKRFDHWLKEICPEGVDSHLDHFLGLDDPDVNLVAIVNVAGTLGTATSKRILLPGFFFETRASHPFVAQEMRLEPVDMHYADQVTDQVIYHLPAGFTVEGAPQTNQINWPGHAALATKAVSATGQVTVVRQFIRGFTFVKPADYQDLRGFYQKVATSDQQQLVLTSSPSTKGN